MTRPAAGKPSEWELEYQLAPKPHGHVVPNADGSKASCGGPVICAECQRERRSFREQISSAEAIRNLGK